MLKRKSSRSLTKLYHNISIIILCHPRPASPSVALAKFGSGIQIVEIVWRMDSRRSLPSTPIGGGNDNFISILSFSNREYSKFRVTIIYLAMPIYFLRFGSIYDLATRLTVKLPTSNF